MSAELDQLIALSRELGREDRKLAILGEGNTSCRVSEQTFLVKASGSSLGTMTADDVTECRFAPLLELMDRGAVSDEEISRTLLASRVSERAKRPSTEAMFHAYLLTLPGVRWVGHTHPIVVNGILCSKRAADFANRRLFPDEIVCCGKQSVLVPYVDPGLPLAQAIRTGVLKHQDNFGGLPRIILLANHGLIAPAPSVAGVLTATQMAVKAAEIFNLAAIHGGPLFLDQSVVDRIESRDDEEYRRQRLGIAATMRKSE
jgi:rhamnose utilization protein RhaD (predicted bifunctional aldolase and dehydrogenase)